MQFNMYKLLKKGSDENVAYFDPNLRDTYLLSCSNGENFTGRLYLPKQDWFIKLLKTNG